MSLNPSFTASPTSDPSAILLTDTSTGSDGAVTDRQITLIKSDGTQLGNPLDWPIADASITVNPLDKDYSLSIIVNWNNSSGVPLYTVSLLYAATQYAEQFYYGLTQDQTSKPTIIQDQQYFENKSILRTLIDSANQAISVGKDIFSSQVCISLYQQMIANKTLYF